MKQPLLSIGIMTYNYGHFIEHAIESILLQDFKDWELVISDDNSSDNTSEIVNKYLSDSRIKYIKHPENLGQANNWNYILKNAAGKYVCVLHADDYWLQGILSNTISFFEQNPDCDMIYYNWKVFNKSELILDNCEVGPNTISSYNTGPNEFVRQIKKFSILPSSIFLKNELVKKHELTNPSLKLAVDTEYFIRLAYHAKYIKCFNDELLVYRIHGNSESDSARKSGITDFDKELLGVLFEPIFSKDSIGKKGKKTFNYNLGLYFLSRSYQVYCENNIELAIRYLKKSIMYKKTNVFFFKFWIICMLIYGKALFKKNLSSR